MLGYARKCSVTPVYYWYTVYCIYFWCCVQIISRAPALSYIFLNSSLPFRIKCDDKLFVSVAFRMTY
jgi:hypothetical protein